MDGLLISGARLVDIERVVERAMASRLTPLMQEVAELRELIRQSRPVITHKIAPLFFDEEVSPETVIDYIKYRGLPAHKNGRKWFIYLVDLMDWQIGLIGFSQKVDDITVIAPRHASTEENASLPDQVDMFDPECLLAARPLWPSAPFLGRPALS